MTTRGQKKSNETSATENSTILNMLTNSHISTPVEMTQEGELQTDPARAKDVVKEKRASPALAKDKAIEGILNVDPAVAKDQCTHVLW